AAGGLLLGEVDLAGEPLALAEDLEPARRERLAPAALHRHQELLVHPELLLLEHDARHQRLLTALVGELLERREQPLLAAAELVDLDDVLDVVERRLEEADEVDLPALVGLVLPEARLRLLLDRGGVGRRA